MKLNPNKAIVEKVRENIKKNDGHCPCSIVHTKDTMCPCKFMRENSQCRCGLYVA